MSNLKKELIEEIRRTVKEFNITGYEISKNTNITESGINRILNGTTTNPHLNTLHTIMDYLATKKVGSNLPGHKNYTEKNTVIEEPKPKYEADPFKEVVLKRKSVEALTLINKALKARLVDKGHNQDDINIEVYKVRSDNPYEVLFEMLNEEERQLVLQQKLKIRLENHGIDFEDITEP